MLLGSSHSALMGPSPFEFTRSSGNASRTVLPASPASDLAASTIRAAWPADRASIQSRHGRRGSRSAPSATTEQQVVSAQSARTSTVPPSRADATAPPTAERRQAYQSSGLCSAHPARGCDVAYAAADDEPTTAPVSASKQHARMDSVPPSTPMTTLLGEEEATRSSSETRRRRSGGRRGPGRDGGDAIIMIRCRAGSGEKREGKLKSRQASVSLMLKDTGLCAER
mmetsp:Transcript_14388/g.33055  ORF Transcript_14388/g.33055 Transcript_14388/m.33055 type:complete len:226 (-) Transcript_14388:10-687(-)